MRMERQLDLIHTALVVRDPGTSLSAQAYEGLRKQVIAGVGARQAHLAQLAEIDAALHRGISTDDLRTLMTQWLEQAGVARVRDPAQADAFDAAVPAGARAEVEVPAYVDTANNQLVRQGRLRALETGPQEPSRDDRSVRSPSVASRAEVATEEPPESPNLPKSTEGER